MGTLQQKIHHDNTAMTYTYTPAGRPANRLAARGVPTSYGYNNAGELESVRYSVGIEGVNTRYNRLDQSFQMSNGSQSSQTTYSFVGQWMAEEVTSAELNGLKFTAELDELGRLTQIKATVNKVLLAQMDYDYASTSHLKSIANFQGKVNYTCSPCSTYPNLTNMAQLESYMWFHQAVLLDINDLRRYRKQ